jgi:methionyl-tRNA formyltransferase
MTAPRIVFLGTPAFAVASLDAIRRAGFEVAGVVTAPDRPAGRGMRPGQSAVKAYALRHALRLLQPERLRAPAFLDELRSLQADLQVVVAFRMLPEAVWAMPPMGTVNLHGSLLPRYRGAAPIQHAILNGETVTGVTTFRLKHEVDTGDILLQEPLPIGPDETAGELHDRMMTVGADLLVRTLQGLAHGSLQPLPQADIIPDDIPRAPKIRNEDCRIEWDRPVQAVHNQVRGLSPVPGAQTTWQGRLIKLYRSRPLPGPVDQPPGTLQAIDGQTLRIACADGWLHVLELQMEGRRRMPVAEFLKGFRP